MNNRRVVLFSVFVIFLPVLLTLTLYRRVAEGAVVNEGAHRVAMTHINRGLAEMRKGRLYNSYARQEFQFVIGMKTDTGLKSVAYLNLGVMSFLEGQLDQAIQHYYSAIELRPDYAEAYFNLGSAYYKQGTLRKAEEAFLKAIELQPDYGRAHYSLGTIYFEQKKYDLARKHADKAEESGVPYKALKEKLKTVEP